MYLLSDHKALFVETARPHLALSLRPPLPRAKPLPTVSGVWVHPLALGTATFGFTSLLFLGWGPWPLNLNPVFEDLLTDLPGAKSMCTIFPSIATPGFCVTELHLHVWILMSVCRPSNKGYQTTIVPRSSLFQHLPHPRMQSQPPSPPAHS